MSLLLAAALFVQAGVRDDVSDLRRYLGTTYRATVDLLNIPNQTLLRNTERLAPEQAAQMRAEMMVPERLAANHPVVSAAIQNIGRGLVTFLFVDDFVVERVNFVFCQDESNPATLEHVMAIQVLFDDSRTIGSTVGVLQNVYQLQAPLVPGPNFKPQLPYPLTPNLPATFWDLGNAEAVYQAVPGLSLITGQLWLTSKTIAAGCAKTPKLPTP